MTNPIRRRLDRLEGEIEKRAGRDDGPPHRVPMVIVDENKDVGSGRVIEDTANCLVIEANNDADKDRIIKELIASGEIPSGPNPRGQLRFDGQRTQRPAKGREDGLGGFITQSRHSVKRLASELQTKPSRRESRPRLFWLGFLLNAHVVE